MLFDTHCHVNDEAYHTDRDEMLTRAFAAGVDYLLCPGTNLETSASAVAMAHKYKQIYAAVGYHPEEAVSATPEGFEQLRNWLVTDPKVVAIGEVGLDYYWPEPARELQQEVFIEQVKMAVALDVPLDIHDREAHGDTVDILRKYGKVSRGVFHCYSGSMEMAKEVIKMGFYLGFGGTTVFPKSVKLKDIVSKVPEDRILIETDCPYLTPPPFRGRRNEPAYVRYVADEIARLRNTDTDTIQQLTLENGKRIFAIP